jgi:hypothetical protein
MNLKETKIRGVQLSVCSVEQKIAYNICLRYYGLFANSPRIAWNLCIIKDAISGIDKKYNKDLVSHYCLSNFERFVRLENHIFSSYQEIGSFFANGYKRLSD